MSVSKKLALVGAALAAGIVPLAAQAGTTSECAAEICPALDGRMTGSGQVLNYAGFKSVKWVFRNTLCGEGKLPGLKVTFGGKVFILTGYTFPVDCLDTRADEGQPKAGFDTIIGQGTGVLNGDDGASATFSFTDAGEPGKNDTATITITDADGNVVFQITNAKISAGGNNQAHKSNK